MVSYRYRLQTLYQLSGGRAQTRDILRQRVRWWSGHWSPDAELMLLTTTTTTTNTQHPHHHNARIVPATAVRQPGAGATQVSDSSNNITGAWSPLSIDIGNAVKIISTSTSTSSPVVHRLSAPSNRQTAATSPLSSSQIMCHVCYVTSHIVCTISEIM